jgi:hypothetical protein
MRDRHAMHRGAAGASDAQPIEIIEGKPGDRALAAGDVGPVYALKPAGTPAVPTGLVFVRFETGVKATERSEDIERAGYKIARTVEYSPGAACHHAISGFFSSLLVLLRHNLIR